MAVLKEDIIAAAQKTLDAAQDFAGVPRSSDQLVQLTLDKQSLQAQVTDLTTQLAMIRADAAALEQADAAEDAARAKLVADSQ